MILEQFNWLRQMGCGSAAILEIAQKVKPGIENLMDLNINETWMLLVLLQEQRERSQVSLRLTFFPVREKMQFIPS